MKVELHINGAHQVILVPETPVERAVLSQMQEAAGKGRAVRLSQNGVTDSVTVSVDA